MVDVTIKSEYDKVSMSEDDLIVQVSLTGNDEVEDNKHRAPVSITMIVDTSSSMQGQLIELVQKACRFVFKNCRPDDMIGLIQYDSNAKEVFPLTKTSDFFVDYACMQVDRMDVSGMTNMHDGIMKGLQQQKNKKYREMKVDPDSVQWKRMAEMQENTALFPKRHLGSALSDARLGRFRRQRVFENEHFPYEEFDIPDECVQSVFLFTDGMANTGPVKEELVSKVKTMLQQCGNVKMSTFGFGNNHDDKVLVDLAEACDGKYYYMKTEDEIPAAFADAVGGLQSLAAESISIEIIPHNNAAVSKVFTDGTSMTLKSHNGTCAVSCGSVVCGASKDLLFRMTIPQRADPIPDDGPFHFADVKVSGLNVQSTASFNFTKNITVDRVQEFDPCQARVRNLDVAYQVVRLDLSCHLETAQEFVEMGDYDGARNYLKNFNVTIASLFGFVQQAGRQDLCNMLLFLKEKLNDAIMDCDVGHGRTRDGNVKSMKMRNRAFKMQSNDCRDEINDIEGEDDGVSMAKCGSKRQRDFRTQSKNGNW